MCDCGHDTNKFAAGTCPLPDARSQLLSNLGCVMTWLGMVQLHNIILTTSRTKQGSGQNKNCKQKATN